MKYKVGDVVRVKEREDLKKASMIRDVYVSSEMFEYAGKLATICKVDTDYCTYFIEEDDKTHIWISEFFEDEEENSDVEKEEKSDEYENIIEDVLGKMSEKTKDDFIKKLIKEIAKEGNKVVTLVAVPVYEIVCRHDGIAVQRIVDSKYSVTVTTKDGVVVL